MNLHQLAGLYKESEARRVYPATLNVTLQPQSYQAVKQDNKMLLLKMEQSDMRCGHMVSPALSPSPMISYRDCVQG